MDIDKLLAKKGLKFSELTADEQEVMHAWIEAFNKSEVNVHKIRGHMERMRLSVEDALTKVNETPTDWLSLFSLFIPFVGIIRKWYMDQQRLMLTARLRNYILLEALLLSPERAKESIERSIASMTSGVSR